MQNDLHAALMPLGRRDDYARWRGGVIGAFVIDEEKSAVDSEIFVAPSHLSSPETNPPATSLNRANSSCTTGCLRKPAIV
jgi:hypothetical protein